MASEVQVPMRLWPIAVRADGRRGATAGALDDRALVLPGAEPDVIVLDHAGPCAASWSADRAVGAADIAEVQTGRRPRALDDAGWRALIDAYAQAAAVVRAAGRALALGVDDDGLLQSALSPRTGGATAADRLGRVLAIHRAVGPIDAALCVEELCPGGLDATDGIEVARALVAQGARTIYASAGSRAFPPLLTREKGESVGDPALALPSAAWLVGRVAARVVAVVPRGNRTELLPRARSLGLDDVLAREPA